MRLGTVSALAAGLVAGLFGLVATVARGGSVEEPSFVVESSHNGWEVRRYAPMVEARVTVRGPFEAAMSDGFRVLAAYIFGGNAPKVSIAMTAPVSAAPATLAMTAPVSAAPAGDQAWTVAFTMPASYTLQTLPAPLDPRVNLVVVQGARVAVRRYSGWATAERNAAEEAALLTALRAAGLQPGEVRIAQYDPPWTPAPLRRNEIQVALPPPG